MKNFTIGMLLAILIAGTTSSAHAASRDRLLKRLQKKNNSENKDNNDGINLLEAQQACKKYMEKYPDVEIFTTLINSDRSEQQIIKKITPLIEKNPGMLDLEIVKNSARTPFFYVIKSSKIEVARFILKKIPTLARNIQYMQQAFDTKNMEIFKLLAHYNADVNYKNAQHQTFLHAAASEANSEAVGILLAAKADPNATTTTGLRPLNYAVETDLSGIIAAQLLAAKAEPTCSEIVLSNADLKQKLSLLIAATRANNVNVIPILLQAGSDILETQDFIPLLLAAHDGNHAILSLFFDHLEQDANNEQIIMDLKADTRLMLHYAITSFQKLLTSKTDDKINRDIKINTYLETCKVILAFFCRHNLNIKQHLYAPTDAFGISLFDIACATQYGPLLELLHTSKKQQHEANTKAAALAQARRQERMLARQAAIREQQALELRDAEIENFKNKILSVLAHTIAHNQVEQDDEAMEMPPLVDCDIDPEIAQLILEKMPESKAPDNHTINQEPATPPQEAPAALDESSQDSSDEACNDDSSSQQSTPETKELDDAPAPMPTNAPHVTFYNKQTEKQFYTLESEINKRFLSRLHEIITDEVGKKSAKKLKGFAGIAHTRVGDYRLNYYFEDEMTITVLAVYHRSNLNTTIKKFNMKFA